MFRKIPFFNLFYILSVANTSLSLVWSSARTCRSTFFSPRHPRWLHDLCEKPRKLTLISLDICVLLNPLFGVHKRLNPRRNFIIFPVFRIIRPVPRENGPFKMWHHHQMTPGFVRHHRCVEITAIGAGRQFVVSIFCNDSVMRFFFGEAELSFPVWRPNSQRATC